jgi:hypothetical protein
MPHKTMTQVFARRADACVMVDLASREIRIYQQLGEL